MSHGHYRTPRMHREASAQCKEGSQLHRLDQGDVPGRGKGEVRR
jgi:hypothetical protein